MVAPRPLGLPTLLLAVALGLAAPSAGQPQPASAEVEALSGEIDAKWQELDELRDRIRELDAAGEESGGDAAVAMRSQALEARLESVDRLASIVDLVGQLEAAGGDASAWRQELAELLPRIQPAYRDQLEAAEAELARLRDARDEAGPEERVAIQQDIARQSAVLTRLLEVGLANVEMLEGLGLDATEARAFLVEEAQARARLLSGLIERVTAQLADAEARGAAAPDDAAIKAEIATLNARLDTDTASLSSLVALMTSLELETAAYQQLLIESTGEITTAVFDRRVMGGLVDRWTASLKESVAENGPRVLFRTLVFVLILAVFWGLSRVVRRITQRAVDGRHLRFSVLLKRMIVSLASGSVLVMGVLVGLGQLGVEIGPVLAGLGIAGFVVGFALQDTLANFAAGVMILMYRPYDVGDLIECASGVFGKVSAMNLVSTTVLTLDNQTRVVPNGKIWGDVITNVTAQRHRRVDMVFGISYSDAIPDAEKILNEILAEHPKVLDDPEPIVRLHELGDSSVNFIVRPWVLPEDYWDVHWDVTRSVKMRFDAEGITIPFPQRDVHFHPAVGGAGAGDPAAPSGDASAP